MRKNTGSPLKTNIGKSIGSFTATPATTFDGNTDSTQFGVPIIDVEVIDVATPATVGIGKRDKVHTEYPMVVPPPTHPV